MNSDSELLRCHLEEKSEAAFRALVQRHVGLVYSVALRRVGGDAHLAEDVTQTVFNDLARKAPTLRDRATLGGWLYASAHFASAAVVRSERRRKAREFAAHDMQTTTSSADTDPDWSQLRPVIDDAIVELKDEEREAVALRFFQKQSFAEIGAALRVTEEAARKRVDRALDKLRATLERRGVTSTTTALGLTLTAIGATSAPTGLGAKVAGQAMASASVPAGGSVMGTIVSATLPAAAVLVLGGWLVGAQRQANHELRAELTRLSAGHGELAALRTENRQLARQIAQADELRERVAAPAVSATARPGGTRQAVVARPISANLAVTEAGTVAFNGNMMSLADFIQRLRMHRTTMDPETRIHLSAPGAPIGAITWVLDEARKAGISHLTIEGSAKPDETFSLWWF